MSLFFILGGVSIIAAFVERPRRQKPQKPLCRRKRSHRVF